MKIKVGEDEYEVPLDDFTGREAATIKRLTGVRLGEITDALEAGDYEVIAALAVVSAGRAGQELDYEELLDKPIDAISAVDESERPTEAPASDEPVSASATPEDDGPPPTPSTSD